MIRKKNFKQPTFLKFENDFRIAGILVTMNDPAAAANTKTYYTVPYGMELEIKQVTETLTTQLIPTDANCGLNFYSSSGDEICGFGPRRALPLNTYEDLLYLTEPVFLYGGDYIRAVCDGGGGAARTAYFTIIGILRYDSKKYPIVSG